jgi:hypothetical protein
MKFCSIDFSLCLSPLKINKLNLPAKNILIKRELRINLLIINNLQVKYIINKLRSNRIFAFRRMKCKDKNELGYKLTNFEK